MTTSSLPLADRVLIPDTLLSAKTNADLELWEATWTPTSAASLLQELQARNDLYVERFVRRNVSKAKFREWQKENPRTFTTAREQQHLKTAPMRPE
ncbi:hypothetical protein IS481_08480 [Caldimonas thermodepolymerans]|uniref:Uncharacterized protein n=1 Tax=Caldimonas thermodepolymerans TaxID=215580 RepID=A0A2S5T7K0_9BURK|nr:hypothetical protein [Caldimonas thermodepolymerans]PPE70936.1 hypothetical protein C1702_05235 [Caldimonas thermodepolymerans]QPC33162.1 hypothetical protein IS481_08480 [Caldimonas thermodepolymerans]RDI03954.1 hypothetical protein DES46_101646 [Caldimonas thermodepolymerans]